MAKVENTMSNARFNREYAMESVGVAVRSKICRRPNWNNLSRTSV